MTPDELSELAEGVGESRYRGRQLFQWLHARGARSLDEMRNLPKSFRDWLAENTEMGGIADVVAENSSADGSTKFLFKLHDGRKVESVLMPDPKRGYFTLCLSSQVGCAVDCKFCVTGFNGFFRQMGADEIVDQVLVARRHLLERKPDAIFRNLVYMGMGEPLLNPDAVIRSIQLVTDEQGINLSPRRITVSTSGIVPGIRQLGNANTGVALALSLNAPTQAERERIMPITRKYPLNEVLAAVRAFPLKSRRRVTFEYVLLAGINDSLRHARQVADLVRGTPCKINLIPFNEHGDLPFKRPDLDTVNAFAQVLLDANFTVSVRWSKALDVNGACGQLAGDSRQRLPRPAATPTPGEPMGDLDFFAPIGEASTATAEED